MVSGIDDKTIKVKVWGILDGKELASYTGHTREISNVAITPDGRKAITTSYDGTLKIWALPT